MASPVPPANSQAIETYWLKQTSGTGQHPTGVQDAVGVFGTNQPPVGGDAVGLEVKNLRTGTRVDSPTRAHTISTELGYSAYIRQLTAQEVADSFLATGDDQPKSVVKPLL